jgi:hypothetical protein
MLTFKTPSRRVVMTKTINRVARLIKQISDRQSFSQIVPSRSCRDACDRRGTRKNAAVDSERKPLI